MYRQYQNPWDLEASLKRAKAALAAALERDEREDRIISLHEDVADLEEKYNFAIQDMEYDEYYC